jgi:hypothetical protein
MISGDASRCTNVLCINIPKRTLAWSHTGVATPVL